MGLGLKALGIWFLSNCIGLISIQQSRSFWGRALIGMSGGGGVTALAWILSRELGDKFKRVLRNDILLERFILWDLVRGVLMLCGIWLCGWLWHPNGVGCILCVYLEFLGASLTTGCVVVFLFVGVSQVERFADFRGLWDSIFWRGSINVKGWAFGLLGGDPLVF